MNQISILPSLKYKIILNIILYLFTGSIFLYSEIQTDRTAKIPGRPDGWTTASHHKLAECNYDLLFDDTKVHEMKIIISPEKYREMEEDVKNIKMGSSDNPIYAPVTVIFNGLTWNFVGMRYKGNSTLSSAVKIGHKLPFRLNFSKYDDIHPEISDQGFYGFEKMTFSNNYSDASFLREKLCADIFREGGVPAARGAFYRVFVDSGKGFVYWGLYTMVEEPSDAMIFDQFGQVGDKQYGVKGNLYKPEGEAARWTFFDKNSFIKKSNNKAKDYRDIQEAIDALHGPRDNAQQWRANLEKVFNVPLFIRWLAINTAIVNWDSYGTMTQNYYLYSNPADQGRLVWFPWDLNMSMDLKSSPVGCLTLALNEVEDDWPLIRYVMDDPLYNKLYHQELAAALEGCMNETRLIPYIKKLHQMIRPFAVGKEGEIKGYTFLTGGVSEFDQALVELLDHIKERNKAVRNYLNSFW